MSNLVTLPGWVILVKSGNGRWRIGWYEMFVSRAEAKSFLSHADWTQEAKIVRGTMSALTTPV